MKLLLLFARIKEFDHRDGTKNQRDHGDRGNGVFVLRHLGDLYAESGQTLQGSFSAAAAVARSRRYRSQILQVNPRWKALAEIYTMHSFAPFFNLKISAKNRQHFFAIE